MGGCPWVWPEEVCMLPAAAKGGGWPGSVADAGPRLAPESGEKDMPLILQPRRRETPPHPAGISKIVDG